MADTLAPVAHLLAYVPCDRCHTVRSTEVWSANHGDLLLSFCQHHANRYAEAMWVQGFRPIMKAPVT